MLQEEEDLPYEEEIIRSPYSVKFWIRYIEHKAKKGSNTALNLLYERSLKELPGRYGWAWVYSPLVVKSKDKQNIIVDAFQADAFEIWKGW